MAFPQLGGRVSPGSSRPSSARLAALIVIFGVIVTVAAWRLVPHGAADPPASGQAAAPGPKSPISDRDASSALAMAHAEQQLVNAQEQLATARRLLSTLSPQLARTYLQGEKRRADAAWTACDSAQRFVEQAIDDLKSIKNKE